MVKLLANQKGLTLMEVVVASAIVALVVVSLLITISQSAVFTEESDKIYTASILAQRRIDVLKNFAFSDLPDTAPEADTPIDVNGDDVTDYYRTTEITENYDGYSDLMQIKVSVDRVVNGEKSGNPVTMETLFVDMEEG